MQGFLCKISLSLRCLCMSAGSIFAAGESFQGKHHIGVCSGLFMDAFSCESWKMAIRPDFYCPRRGKCLSCRIRAVPAGNSASPCRFALSTQSTGLILPDLYRRLSRRRLSGRIGRFFDVGKFPIDNNPVNLPSVLLSLISPPFSDGNSHPIASAYGRWASGCARRP